MKLRIELGFVILIGLFALIIFLLALQLEYRSSAIPTVVSALIMLLTIIEVIRFRHLDHGKIKKTNDSTVIQDQIKVNHQTEYMMIWLVINVASIYVLGFLAGIFASSLIYFRIFIYKSVFKCIIAAFIIGTFIYVVFIVLAGFHLYQGVFS